MYIFAKIMNKYAKNQKASGDRKNNNQGKDFNPGGAIKEAERERDKLYSGYTFP